MDYSYIGSGKIYIREQGSTDPFEEVGNCSALQFSVSEDVKELKDFTQPGGGTYNEVRRISAVEMSLTAHDLNPANLARSVFGDATNIASGTASAEAITARIGFNLLAKVPTSITTVTNTGATVTYVAGTDYEFRDGGLYVISGGAITDGAAIKVTYPYATQDAVEALIQSAKNYEMVFVGLNEARSGKVVRVHAHRVKIGAAQQIALIGDDYAALQVSGKLQKDTTKNGTSVSQYFKSDLVA